MAFALRLFQRTLRCIGHAERWLGVGLIAIMVGAITTQVFTRYLFNRPIIWVEEIATYSFIWAVFVGASLGLKYSRHVKIETFVEHLAPRAKAASRVLVNLIIIAVLWLLVREVGTVINIESRSTSVSLPWPVPRAWFYSIPLAASCVSMMATCVYFILAEIAMIVGVEGLDTSSGIMGLRPTADVRI
ncbi:MAG: TRAP transporter small permease [Sphingomonadales bacterium]|nr:TRAP transporter small permease [Sphingomonadales bacterium]